MKRLVVFVFAVVLVFSCCSGPKVEKSPNYYKETQCPPDISKLTLSTPCDCVDETLNILSIMGNIVSGSDVDNLSDYQIKQLRTWYRYELEVNLVWDSVMKEKKYPDEDFHNCENYYNMWNYINDFPSSIYRLLVEMEEVPEITDEDYWDDTL